MPKTQKAVGFTLLEVLIAMSLLSIMMVLLFSSLKIAAESWNKGENKIAEVNEKAVVYHFFKRHLPGIRPLTADFLTEQEELSFQGKKHSLQFVSVFPASAGRKGLQLFEIKFNRVENGVINVRVQPFFPTKEEQQWKPENVVLLKNVADFKLSYYGAEADFENAVWRDSWQGKKQLPALIKIKINMQDSSYWPEMIFALKLWSLNVSHNKNIEL